MKKILSPITSVTVLAATGAFLVIVLAGPGYRVGFWALGTAFGMAKQGAAAAMWVAGIAVVLILVWAVLERRLSKGAFIALLLFGLPLAQLYQFKQTAGNVPPIHDITTDTVDPPLFVDVVPLRADAPNPVDYAGPEVADQQLKAYPDILPIELVLDVEQSFVKALAAVDAMGWELVASEPATGRIEATDTTFWFGYKDDVVIRIRADNEVSRVDVRSKSRVGGSDIGLNAKRIRAYRDKLLSSL